MTTFQRNAIIAGYINSYCLVCECFFETEEQTFSHIGDEEHERRLLLYPYMEKYGNNGIRKVKAGYFCEHCSLLMATAAKVNLHIAEKLHYNNKGNSLLKQSGPVLTAFDDVMITESAWHSIVDDACAMCDAEFDEANEHMIERSHVLKLLQNKVEFAEDNNIYRKIDKSNIQCLTCNCVKPLSTLHEHFNNDTHKQKYIQCQEEKRKYDLANPKQNKVKKEIKTEVKEKETVGDNVTGKQNVTNNIETVTGISKEAIKKTETPQPETKISSSKTDPQQPTKILPLKTDAQEAAKKPTASNTEKTQKSTTPNTEKTQKSTTSNTEKTQTSTTPKTEKIQNEEQDPATYARDNKLAYDPKNANAFCKTCENKFSATLRGMKEHISGRDHINKTAKAASKPAPKKIKLQKQSSETFVMKIDIFHNTPDNDTVMNESICIPEKSFHLYTKIGCKFAEFKCQICLMNLSEEDLGEHSVTAKHEKGIRESQIILGLKNEFVREIRPETFHCGYCNLMIAGWKATENHLKTQEHITNSANCSRRLLTHLPTLRAQKNDVIVHEAFFQMVINHMRI